MKWKTLIFGVLALAVFCIVPVSAAELLDRSTHEVTTPWYEYTSNSRAIDPVEGSVSQGATQSITCDIPSGKTKLESVLRWSNSQNSLTLKIISPTGVVYGPYSDNFDGIRNGVIPVRIQTNSLPQGIWTFEVKGESVSGTQSFTLSMNAV